jgi:muconolactone delta-isomerase
VYLVRTTFTPPAGMPEAELGRLRDAEAAAAALLQRDGRLLELWRDAETGDAWGVWAAESREALAEAMSSLPCLPHMTVDPHPIIAHPNRAAP